MKKKLLSIMMAAAMVISLAACGNDAGNSGTAQSGIPEQSAASSESDANVPAAPQESSQEAQAEEDPVTCTLKVWAPSEDQDQEYGAWLQTMCEQFNGLHPNWDITFEYGVCTESDARKQVLNDLEAAADVFLFSSTNLEYFCKEQALAELGGKYLDTVNQHYSPTLVKSLTYEDGGVYGVPLTTNTYFMYYDKSVVTDPTSLDQIVKDCEAAGKNFYFDTGSWYQTAFFFGAGCELAFDTDEDGNFTGIKNTYASENGLKALKAIRTMSESKIYMDGSSVGDAVNWAAIVDGTWDSSSAKEVLGDNYACAKLPTFTVDGETFQLGGFGGFKLMGVKPQAEAGKLVVCLELAKYLSDTDAQLARFNEVGWGPSNVTAQQDPAVQADEALSALGEQLQYTIPQGQYPGEYWSEADALGETICGGNFKGYTDEQLMAELEAFSSKMDALVK